MSFLPAPDREYLESKEVSFEEVQDGGQKAIILKAVALPPGRYDAPIADVLIILPPAYPDVAPDMFHLIPWVKLVPAGKYPNAADQPVSFNGQNWQRWSRHNYEWRPGIDGIWTMLKRVEDALARAA
jgi:Prokaryotic E2 family E